MRITKEGIARDYPHRVDANPDACPVCCGDARTTDTRYGGRVLPIDAPVTVYRCRACPVWHGELQPWKMADDIHNAAVKEAADALPSNASLQDVARASQRIALEVAYHTMHIATRNVRTLHESERADIARAAADLSATVERMARTDGLDNDA